jgi:hypothetical protein
MLPFGLNCQIFRQSVPICILACCEILHMTLCSCSKYISAWAARMAVVCSSCEVCCVHVFKWNVSCISAAHPQLLYKFIYQTMQPGPPVSLKCIATGNPTPHITWHLDGFPLPQSDRCGSFQSSRSNEI